MTVEDTANLGLLHRQFSVRCPERVSSHSCFRLESRGHTQHEMGASIAVGRWRRNVRGSASCFSQIRSMFSITSDSQGFYAKPRQPRLLLLPRPLNSRHPTLRRSSGREARPRLQEAPRPSPLEIPAQQPEPLAASPVQGALPLAPAGIEDQLNELHISILQLKTHHTLSFRTRKPPQKSHPQPKAKVRLRQRPSKFHRP